VEKYFPNTYDDNVRQLHGVKEMDLAKWYSDKSKDKNYDRKVADRHRDAYCKEDQTFKATLWPVDLEAKQDKSIRERPFPRSINQARLR